MLKLDSDLKDYFTIWTDRIIEEGIKVTILLKTWKALFNRKIKSHRL